MLGCYTTPWEKLSYENGKINSHKEVTEAKVMAIIMTFLKLRNLPLSEAMLLHNCLKAAVLDNAANTVWAQWCIEDYCVALVRTSDGIIFCWGDATSISSKEEFYAEVKTLS